MTHLTDEQGAAAEYARRADVNQEVMTDGVGEAESEHAGISRVRHMLRVILTGFIMMGVGATLVGAFSWWQTRPDPEVRTLTSDHAGLLELQAKESTDGFNDGALGALVANGYKPVGQSTDNNTHTYYIILARCDRGPTECIKRLDEPDHPVVYLGIPEELPELLDDIHFVAAQVRVDIPIGDGRVKQCSVYRGKAEVGEPWPVSFNLPKTITALQGFIGDADFINRSPDGGASYWECTAQ